MPFLVIVTSYVFALVRLIVNVLGTVVKLTLVNETLKSPAGRPESECPYQSCQRSSFSAESIPERYRYRDPNIGLCVNSGRTTDAPCRTRRRDTLSRSATSNR